MAFVMPYNGLAISLRRCGPSSGQRCTSRRLTIRAAVTVPAEFKTVAPVGDRVFVKVDANEETSIGGILLPTSAQKKPTKGEVVGMGSAKAVKSKAGKLMVDCILVKSGVLKAGDKVVYSKYAGTDLKLGGAEHVILKEDDVIGILAGDNIADLKPLGDRVLIEVAEGEDQTAGGVLLTAASKEKPTMGKVIAVGSGKENDKGEVVAPNLKAGDMVLYSKYSGTEFTGSNDTQYIVVRESDVLASVA